MPKLIPHLWYDREAKEAASFYVSVFPQSKIVEVGCLRDTPSGDCDIVHFEVWGQPFVAFSAGPYFRLNPSISFMVNFDPLFFGSSAPAASAKLDEVWERLIQGGKILMPLGSYPFSEKFGWIEDRFGLSWQLILTRPEGEPRPPILPALMFQGEVCGQAEAARDLYMRVFQPSAPGALRRYGAGQEPNREGTVLFSDCRLDGMWLVMMDNAYRHDFKFNEALSFLVSCDTQEEIDGYWKVLSAVPEAEQCGWLKDRFGVSWQVAPAVLQEMILRGNREQVARVTQAFMSMKKFDLAALKQAYAG